MSKIRVPGPQGQTALLQVYPEDGQTVPAGFDNSLTEVRPGVFETADLAWEDGVYQTLVTFSSGNLFWDGYVNVEGDGPHRAGDWDIDSSDLQQSPPTTLPESVMGEFGPKRVRTPELDVEQFDPVTVAKAKAMNAERPVPSFSNMGKQVGVPKKY